MVSLLLFQIWLSWSDDFFFSGAFALTKSL